MSLIAVAVVAASTTEEPELAAAVVALVGDLGLTPAEVAHLKYGDVVLDRALQPGGRRGRPFLIIRTPEGLGRAVTLTPMVLDRLREYEAEARPDIRFGRSAFFLDARSLPVTEAKVRRLVRDSMRAAGLEGGANELRAHNDALIDAATRAVEDALKR